MFNINLKIINTSTKNELNYDLSKLPNLNQMYEWTWNNFLDYLMNYIPPKDKTYKGPKNFQIEITDSNEQVDDNQIHGIVFDKLSKNEVLAYIKHLKGFEPNIEHTKKMSLHKTKKDD